jgi:hypothetical protein
MLSLEKVANSGMNKVLAPLGFILNMIAPTLAVVSSPPSPFFPDLQKKYDCGEQRIFFCSFSSDSDQGLT